MKDIIIKAEEIRREIFIYLLSFVAACVVNAIAIIVYERPWSELISQIGFVIFISVGIYVLLAMVRILVYLIMKIFKRK